MKAFYALILVLLALTAYGQSNLPACQGSDTARWDNCFGTIKFSGGAEYVGEFKEGKLHGQGIGTFPDGAKYVGEHKYGMPDGFGINTFADGQRYEGEFKAGKRNGQGTITSATRGKYVGEWKDDKYNGLGIRITPDGKRSEGIFENNKFIREAKVNLPNTNSNTANSAERNNLEQERQRLAEERRRLEEEKIRISQEANQVKPNSVPNVSMGKRIALVIGNAKYLSSPLRNPINDANDISSALKQSGFEVIDVRDANLQQMRSAVRTFGDSLLNSDVGLVYYSGHGIESKGRNYFIPVNTDIQRVDEIADQALDVSLILDKMTTAGKGVNILIVDACRDDPLTRSFRTTSKGLAAMDAPKGTIIAYATSPGKLASDGDPKARNSPYTKHLLAAMQVPNRPIEMVFKEVRRNVQNDTKNEQTPWENTSLSGDFYFRVQK